LQLAKALAESGDEIKMNNTVDPNNESSLETELESLEQMMEILVEDLRQTKQELASAHQQPHQGRKVSRPHSLENPTADVESEQDWKATAEALQATNESLEEEIDAVRQENEELLTQMHVVRERLTQTEIDLEDAAFELSQLTNPQQQDGIGERGGPGEQESEDNYANDDDDDDQSEEDQSTETEDEDCIVAEDAEEDGSGSDQADNEEGLSRGDPDVIDLSESPRPKRQRLDGESTDCEDL
jgi:chromosome segregation ATPase